MKMFIMGLDGASYPLICKFVNENKLPNFKKLLKDNKLKTYFHYSSAYGTRMGISIYRGTAGETWNISVLGYTGGKLFRKVYGE